MVRPIVVGDTTVESTFVILGLTNVKHMIIFIVVVVEIVTNIPIVISILSLNTPTAWETHDNDVFGDISQINIVPVVFVPSSGTANERSKHIFIMMKVFYLRCKWGLL